MASFWGSCLGSVAGGLIGGMLLAGILLLSLARRVERLEEEMLTVLEASVRSTARDLALTQGTPVPRSRRWLQ